MFNSRDLHGIIPPICTPLTEQGEIDVASTRRLADFLLESGVHGIFALGSTGEGTSLTTTQRDTVLRSVVAQVNGRVPVLAGILDSSTDRCIEHARAAQAAGVDVLVLGSIYYYRPGQHEIFEHFRAVRAAVDLPILAYDVPTATQVKLEVATVKRLFDEGMIVGIKDSSGAVELFRQLLLLTRGSEFRAFTGSELIVDACLRMGAHGSVPGLANVFPVEYVRLYELAQTGDWDGARELQERLLGCFWELITQGEAGYSINSSALGGFKSALKLKGVIASAQLAAPLHSFSPQDEQRVADVLRKHGFLEAAAC